MGIRKKVNPPAVFLDRDGVLNRAVVRGNKPFAPPTLSRLKIFSDAPASCEKLREAGFLLICVTNQPDVARGTMKKIVVDKINRAVRKKLKLHDVKVCFHDNHDRCFCRKPKPGMLLDAARDWRINLPKSFLVGDRPKDIEAGKRAGVGTIFIERSYSEKLTAEPDFIASSLTEATKWILNHKKKK